MPQLIESGYIYIAQSPLYRVIKGKSEVYLKDERALEQHLIETGMEETVLTIRDESERSGSDLGLLIEEALNVRKLLQGVSQRYSAEVVEQTAIAGALNPEAFMDGSRAQQTSDYVSRRLDQLALESERGWRGEPIDDGGLRFSRVVRGVKESQVIDGRLIRSAEARKLDEKASILQSAYLTRAILRRKGEERVILSPTQLLNAIFSLAERD